MAERLGSAIAVRSIASSGGRESSVGPKPSIVSPLKDFSTRVRGGDGSDTVRLFDLKPLTTTQINTLQKSEPKNSFSPQPIEAVDPVVVTVESAVQNIAESKSAPANILTFPLIEPLAATARINSGLKIELPNVRTPARSEGAEQKKVEAHQVLIRFEQQQARARRMRLRLVSGSAALQTVSSVEESALVEPRVLTENKLLVVSQNPVKAEAQVGFEDKESTLKLPAVSTRRPMIVKRAETEESWRKRFVGADEEVNRERRSELKRVLGKLKTEANRVVNGESLIESSLIQGRAFRSRLLFQTGHEDRADGGIIGIVKELKAKSEVGVSDIEASIENNYALVRTSLRPSRLAQLKELVKVYAGDERLPIKPPVEIEQRELEDSRVVYKREPVKFTAPINSALIPTTETGISTPVLSAEEQIADPIKDNVIDFASRLFDIGVHNIRPSGIDELAERKQLPIAA